MSLLEVDKQLWVGTFGGGISRFDARTRRFDNLRAGPEDGLHLSSGRVTALARDRTGHVWIGTDGGGLNVWDQQDPPPLLLQARRQAARLAAAPTPSTPSWSTTPAACGSARAAAASTAC